MQAKVKVGCSYAWRRELIAQGAKWRVGNRAKISVSRDKWLPNTTCSRILYPVMNLPPNTKFAELIDHENGCWKQELVSIKLPTI